MATGGLEKQYKVGQIFYSIPYFDQCWCYFVHVDSQKSVFKSCMRKVAPDHPYSSKLLFYAKCKQEARVLFHTFS